MGCLSSRRTRLRATMASNAQETTCARTECVPEERRCLLDRSASTATCASSTNTASPTVSCRLHTHGDVVIVVESESKRERARLRLGWCCEQRPARETHWFATTRTCARSTLAIQLEAVFSLKSTATTPIVCFESLSLLMPFSSMSHSLTDVIGWMVGNRNSL